MREAQFADRHRRPCVRPDTRDSCAGMRRQAGHEMCGRNGLSCRNRKLLGKVGLTESTRQGLSLAHVTVRHRRVFRRCAIQVTEPKAQPAQGSRGELLPDNFGGAALPWSTSALLPFARAGCGRTVFIRPLSAGPDFAARILIPPGLPSRQELRCSKAVSDTARSTAVTHRAEADRSRTPRHGPRPART